MTTSKPPQEIILLKNGNLWCGMKQLLHGAKLPLGITPENPVILTMSTEHLSRALLEAANNPNPKQKANPRKPIDRYKGWDVDALAYVMDNWGALSYNVAVHQVEDHFELGPDAAIEMMEAAIEYDDIRKTKGIDKYMLKP